jgi:hypothetical protein
MCFLPPCRREKNTDNFTVSISFEYELERVVVVNNIYTFYWNNYKLHNILLYVLLLMCTVSYHYEDNRIINDILKRLYTFPR